MCRYAAVAARSASNSTIVDVICRVKVHSFAAETSFTRTEFNGGVSFFDGEFGCAQVFRNHGDLFTYTALARYQPIDVDELACFEGDRLLGQWRHSPTMHTSVNTGPTTCTGSAPYPIYWDGARGASSAVY